MRILVTGGAGFIGSHLCEKLLSDGHTVYCWDNFNDYYDPALKRKNLYDALNNPRFFLFENDILDFPKLQKFFETNCPEIVVHLAARAGVRPSIQQPLLYEQVNVQGTIHLLELSRSFGVGKFIFASSSSVYGANTKVPFSESDNVDFPISPYAATKKAGELICYTYYKLYGLPITCLRFFTVYGPRQRPDMAIHKFARLMWEGKKIPVYGDGGSRRDYTYYTDILQGILASIERCRDYQIYNLGESNTVELLYLIRLLEEALGCKAQIDFLPDQPGDVPITFADISKARRELDYIPKVPIEEGVRLFADWFLNLYQ
ncbi:MAG: GDP-mannose 4,6-dehydratase [candidate division KSB1 bacterium]|nr:GDP-mannose 4,6-dehydratase [candidate division KSB1 bacterium]